MISHIRKALLCSILFISLPAAMIASDIHLTDSQALAIGKRIWKNECAGTVDGLTSWNNGEAFASLGIGHFIWYPADKRGPYEESFPALVQFLKANIKPTEGYVPKWLEGPCPWKTREEFMRDFESPRMKELRQLLVNTVALQARFAALRLEKALDKMLAAAPASERAHVRENFYRVAATPMGLYALMDYVNFKGEGVSPTERYKDQGWGLLQVLETMKPTGPALPAFADAASTILTRRVQNAPKNESQWLPGWKNRLKTYVQ